MASSYQALVVMVNCLDFIVIVTSSGWRMLISFRPVYRKWNVVGEDGVKRPVIKFSSPCEREEKLGHGWTIVERLK